MPMTLPSGQTLPRSLLMLPPEHFKGPYPAVLILEMRGEHTLSSVPTGQPIYAQMAEALARAGIASLRYASVAYESQPIAELYTEQRLLSEASAALYYLRTLQDIDSARCGVLGHALGALTGMHLARNEPSACSFLALLNPPGLPIAEILLDRKRAQMEVANAPLGGLSPVDHLYRAVKGCTGDPQEKRWIRWLVWRVARVERGLSQNPVSADSMRRYIWKTIKTPSFRSLLAQEPSALLAGIQQPILTLHALKDSEILPIENMDAIRSVLKKSGHRHFTQIKVKALNHLFLPAYTGSPAEYPQINAPIPEEPLQQISDWILGLEETLGVKPATVESPH